MKIKFKTEHLKVISIVLTAIGVSMSIGCAALADSYKLALPWYLVAFYQIMFLVDILNTQSKSNITIKISKLIDSQDLPLDKINKEEIERAITKILLDSVKNAKIITQD